MKTSATDEKAFRQTDSLYMAKQENEGNLVIKEMADI